MDRLRKILDSKFRNKNFSLEFYEFMIHVIPRIFTAINRNKNINYYV